MQWLLARAGSFARRIVKDGIKSFSYPVRLRSRHGPCRGRVLFSYIPHSLRFRGEVPELSGHSNAWESREIAGIFLDLGFAVDGIGWDDTKFVPRAHYDVVFDIHTNLARWESSLDRQTIKILHCTGSDPFYQNEAEHCRIDAMLRRRGGGGTYVPRRVVPEPDLARRSLELADACALIGNEHTRSTYPVGLQQKMTLVTVTSSPVTPGPMTLDAPRWTRRRFLWFFGGGAVHKGLDRVLEVFSRNPDLTLHVVGPASTETDFAAIYHHELTACPNIRVEGVLAPGGDRFRQLLDDVFCFVAPSCSEGMSPAVATCMQAGLHPIISRDTGVTLPAGCGTYLETCEIDEIERAVLQVNRLPLEELFRQVKITQCYAGEQYSRKQFRTVMGTFIARAVEKGEGGDPLGAEQH